MRTPTLQTDRLLLRPFTSVDAKDVFDCWESDPDVAKYMFWTSHNDIEKTREWIAFEIGQIEKEDWYRFAIVLKETEELIGTALIYFEEEVDCWEIGYNLGKKYWSKGYTTEAMKRVMEFATEELELSQIVGRYAKENPASGNVMKKLGFQYEKDIPYECNDGTIKREGIQCRFYNQVFVIREYNKKYENSLIAFLQQCLPESGRNLDLSGRHKFYQDIENYFVAFWCMFDNDKIVGTVAVKELDKKKCELKLLYLLECHHGKGLGQSLLRKAVDFAKESGYEKMYLDSLSTSKKALALYHKTGFVQTKQYNQNEFADIFMVLNLQG